MFAFTKEISYRKFFAVLTLVLMATCLHYPAVADSITEFPPAKGDQAIAEESAQRILKDAKAGDMRAQFALAVMYQNGTMVPQSDIEAVKWFEKAADQGDAKAQFMMGNAYLKGRGTICDDVEAVKWYQKAADQGSAEGQFGLAMEYHLGHGVVQNDVEAYFWLSLSAQGNQNAVPVLELVRQKLTVQQLKDVRERVKQWKTKRES